MLQNTSLNIFNNALDNKGTTTTFNKVVNSILKEYKNITNQYRSLPPGKEKDKQKKTIFKAVTFSGTFTKRKADCLQQHSGFICLDIDKLDIEALPGYIKFINQDPHTFFSFISPSGKGLKVIFKIDIKPNNNVHEIQAQHTQAFSAIAAYFMQQWGLVIDESGKDVSRLCFICHDSNAYLNTDAAVFVVDSSSTTTTTKEKPKQEKRPTTFTKLNTTEQSNFLQQHNTVYAVEQFTNNKLQLTTGNRNNWIYLFACNCNRKGIEMHECLSHAHSLCSDKDNKEIEATVKSAYTHHAAEFSKYKTIQNEKNKNNTSISKTTKNSTQKTEQRNKPNVPTPKTFVNDTQSKSNNGTTSQPTPIQFWSKRVNKKTGEESTSIYYTNFYKFLESQGFFNLKLDKQNVELIHIKSNVVSPVIITKFRNDIKQHLNAYCEENKLWDVLEMLHRGQDKYIARGQFVNLNYKKIDFMKDDKDVSYHFHINGVVECRKTGITFRDYETGEKMLWESQINPRPFTRTSILFDDLTDGDVTLKKIENIIIQYQHAACVFAQFQILASSNPNNEEISLNTRLSRFLAHATSFGYLINNHKPAIGKAVVGTDHHISIDRKEQMGRTGKGILSKAVGFVTQRFAVDGRKFDPKDQSVFENLTMDSKVITVDDCHARFDFGHFFVPITEDFTIRKMYLGYITIPYDDSPKWYFNTNFTFKGDGDSFSGRQHIIEFDNFFNKAYTPIHHFNHTLFKDWNDDEWNKFFNYAYECDCLQQNIGLWEYAEGNYLQRKLSNECPQEFIDFIEAHIEANDTDKTKTYLNFPFHTWLEKKKLLEAWTKECQENKMQTSSSKGFYNMLKQYCIANGIGFYNWKAGNVEKYWIGFNSPLLDNKTKQRILAAPNEKGTTQQQQIFEL